MRINVYAEEMTNRVEIVTKEVDGQTFAGLRLYLELPVTVGGEGSHRVVEGGEVFPPVAGGGAQVAGPFIHHPGDDDSSAVTFWGKRDLRRWLKVALIALDEYYSEGLVKEPATGIQQRRALQEALDLLDVGLMDEDLDSDAFCGDQVPRAADILRNLLLTGVATESGAERIRAERVRQKTEEGFGAIHDRLYSRGELVAAAACYLVHGTPLALTGPGKYPPGPWPWRREWDKRGKHPLLRRLEIAGALIAAEIDRIQLSTDATEPTE